MHQTDTVDIVMIISGEVLAIVETGVDAHEAR